MAKRFHGGHKHNEGHYEGSDPRRKQENRDSQMINEDRSAIANMPQHVIMRPFAGEHGYTPENLDDTIRGIDRQMNQDNGKKLHHLRRGKGQE